MCLCRISQLDALGTSSTRIGPIGRLATLLTRGLHLGVPLGTMGEHGIVYLLGRSLSGRWLSVTCIIVMVLPHLARRAPVGSVTRNCLMRLASSSWDTSSSRGRRCTRDLGRSEL